MKILLSLLFSIPFFANAQTTHTVAPKETLYSLSRLYNIPPKELAAYNNIPVETGLTIGQIIKIPAKTGLTENKNSVETKAPPVTIKASTVTENAGATKANINSPGLIPVYHKVEKKETLYHISKLYPYVTIDDIKRWNNLSDDGVSEGANLIVGFEKGKSPLNEPVNNPAETANKNMSAISSPAVSKPVEPETKTANVDIKTIPSKTTAPAKEEMNKITGRNFSGGYFKSLYNDQTVNKKVVEENGTAAVFKSTSGWEDGKYYCLHNSAPAGSVIKITNPATRKFVYAKVLDVIPDLKQNAGIVLRISSSAADELGAGETNFETVINY